MFEAARTRIQVPGSGDAPESDLLTGFKNGFVFELLDVRENAPLSVHVLVLNPERYELTEPHQSTLTATAANQVVDESNGIIQRQIMIEGTFGHSKRRATAFEGAQGNGVALSGSDHFRALRDMFRQYSALKQDPARGAYIRMIFHVLKDDDHFVIAHPTFTSPRDAKSTRLHYRYRIQAEAIGDASLISKLRRKNSLTASSLYSDGTRLVAQAFHDMRAAFAEVNANLGQIRRKIANINSVMVNAAQFINAVGNAVTNASDTFIAYPLKLAGTVTEQIADSADFLAESLADSTVGTLADSARSLRRMEDAFNRILAFPEKFKTTARSAYADFRGELGLTSRDIADGVGGATIGTATRVRRGSGSEAFRAPSYSSVEAVTLQATDSLDSLGSRFSVDPTLIIVINDLRPPYILPGGGPGILSPGDTILIPVQGGGESTEGGGSEDLTAGDVLYGSDFALDPALLERENLLDFRDPVRADAGDLDQVRGIANVAQGVTVTIWTERGSTAFLPSVGITRNVGRKGTIQHVLLAALNLRSAILSDSRIEGIANSTIVLEGDVLSQEITPIITGRRDGTTLVLPFGNSRG